MLVLIVCSVTFAATMRTDLVSMLSTRTRRGTAPTTPLVNPTTPRMSLPPGTTADASASAPGAMLSPRSMLTPITSIWDREN